MTKFTKEQLIEQAKTRMEANQWLLARLPPELATAKEVAMNLAVDEIALAVLTAGMQQEQEPVAKRLRYKDGPWLYKQIGEDGPAGECYTEQMLYAAPQLPRPAVVITNEGIDSIVIPISPDGLDEEKYPIEWHLHHDRERIRKALHEYACRAAMLQGAEQQNRQQNIPENIPTLRDGLAAIRNSGIAIDAERIQAERDALNEPEQGWIPCSERMPERDYVLAADFSGAYYLPSLPNTQVGIYADWFEDGNPSWDEGDGNDLYLKQVTHWMPMPAAPQQEAN
ncbi:DUF551 domain-containing protein [Enterobacteriaceae bacterium H4N4]|uniref:DUF551 domain-containing protein n=1 Tax=Silvania confinis TaxID=2926470 RepID=A0A9J6QBP4_9ENTR|nr:DUF551 domain-containing protein [Silvania confinis]MCU6669943.1 DUF551 domain-containing protein [Silvania confinis]